ncbi:MAG: ferrous iron transporter B [Phycisphaerales bacterium]
MTRAGPSAAAPEAPLPRVAVLGNPNTGKTTLFNRLCGVRARTANFPGSTVESRIGVHRTVDGRAELELIDLPGAYSLTLDVPESRICRDALDGGIDGFEPDAMLIVVDATNLRRNLQFAAQALVRRIPAVIALNMMDLARQRGAAPEPAMLSRLLGCPVVAVSARSGEGMNALDVALDTVAALPMDPDAMVARLQKMPPVGSSPAELASWADSIAAAAAPGTMVRGNPQDTLSDRLDIAFTHPVLGIVVFALMMGALFASIFLLAELPMQLIELLFGRAGDAVRAALPEGALTSLLADGIIPGISGVLVFLPQICMLFFLLTLLEDSGYLARAAFAVDRVMARFGLSGLAFVPLLSSHACALPGIMSTRLIPDPRDRLATILVAPFMSCSARLPVYVLLIGILSAGRPAWFAGVAFAACYALGACAGLLSALVARRTILRGPARAMVLELPTYKWPSLRNAFLTTYDRAGVFLRNAGTTILAICVVMWWLSAYPRAAPTAQETQLREQAAALLAQAPAPTTDAPATEAPQQVAAQAHALEAKADHLAAREQQAHSFAGRIGEAVAPVFAPLGFDPQLTVGVMTSFLAREVFVSTMSVLSGAGSDAEDDSVLKEVAQMPRADGTPVFTLPTAAATLVFFVLAMQCLPTLAVTRRETGSWKWPALQFAWMSAVGYLGAFAAFHLTALLTGAAGAA